MTSPAAAPASIPWSQTPVSSKRMFHVSVTGEGKNHIGGLWANKTGGEFSSDTTKVWDGGQKQPSVLAGPPQASNVVLSRPYHVIRDAPMCKWLRGQVGSLVCNVTVQPTTADMHATGDPVRYTNALLVGLTEPEVDASSGDAGTVSIEFAIGRWE